MPIVGSSSCAWVKFGKGEKHFPNKLERLRIFRQNIQAAVVLLGLRTQKSSKLVPIRLGTGSQSSL